MKNVIVVLFLVMISACASTRIMPIGPDTYMVHKTGGFGSNAGSAQMDALEDAGKYCVDNGKQLVVVSTQSQGVHGFQYPNADIQFRCLSTNDPDLKRPTLEQVPNSVIEVRK